MPGAPGLPAPFTDVLRLGVASMGAMTSCADAYVPSFPLLSQVAVVNHDKGVDSDPPFPKSLLLLRC